MLGLAARAVPSALARARAHAPRSRSYSTLSHVDDDRAIPKMVNVGDKAVTARFAVATSILEAPDDMIELLQTRDVRTAKGPVFATAVIAGTQAVKETWRIIPMCHQIAISGCQIDIDVDSAAKHIVIRCQVHSHGKTGVEMEALTGASVAALTVYDMCKALSHAMVIRETRLVIKDGGRSGRVYPFGPNAPGVDA